MASTNHSKAVRDVLKAAGVNGGQEIRSAPLDSANADQCIACVPSGGASPELLFGGEGVSQSLVEILVRSKPHDYDTGQTLALAAREALKVTQPTGYVEITLLSDLIYTDKDDQDRHIWTFDVVCRIQE